MVQLNRTSAGYDILTDECRISILGSDGIVDEFFRAIDVHAATEIILTSIRHAGYRDVTLVLRIVGSTSGMHSFRNLVRYQIRKKPDEPMTRRRNCTMASVSSTQHLSAPCTVNVFFVDVFRFWMCGWYNDLLHEYGSMNAVTEEALLTELETHFQRVYREKLARTLAHEITHLWHLKRSRALQMHARFKRKLQKMSPEDTYGGGMTTVDRMYRRVTNHGSDGLDAVEDIDRSLHELLATYIWIRKRFMQFSEMLCYEGMAVFMEAYLTGTYHFPPLFDRAAEESIKLQRDFELFLHDFEIYATTVHDMKAAVSRGQDPAQVARSQGRFGQSSFNHIKRFMEDLKHAPYIIGPLLPATLYARGGYSIEQIGVMNPRELINTYVKICRSRHEFPLVTLRTGDSGHFPIGKNTGRLNKLRKKLSIS